MAGPGVRGRPGWAWGSLHGQLPEASQQPARASMSAAAMPLQIRPSLVSLLVKGQTFQDTRQKLPRGVTRCLLSHHEVQPPVDPECAPPHPLFSWGAAAFSTQVSSSPGLLVHWEADKAQPRNPAGLGDHFQVRWLGRCGGGGLISLLCCFLCGRNYGPVWNPSESAHITQNFKVMLN